jgi:hypothetical protein
VEFCFQVEIFWETGGIKMAAVKKTNKEKTGRWTGSFVVGFSEKWWIGRNYEVFGRP